MYQDVGFQKIACSPSSLDQANISINAHTDTVASDIEALEDDEDDLLEL